jgi:HD superfamily phosphohydrolase
MRRLSGSATPGQPPRIESGAQSLVDVRPRADYNIRGPLNTAGRTVKGSHEFRDPSHSFIRVDTAERRVVNTAPFQRLRHIHQLAMTYWVYPGATHRRFEHSLGVMDLADRVYSVVTAPENVHPDAKDVVYPQGSREHLYWRCAIRMAALCHDIGHLPFSHAAEQELLPEGWNHERLTIDLIRSEAMQMIWHEITPPLRADDIVKLAVGPRKTPKDMLFTDWESILAEIIVGDAFGTDRMDYLLRDSHHLGVAYGKYDIHRLVQSLRILPRHDRESNEPDHGIEAGGLESSEALMLARYFMYKQVYFNHVRRIYDIHLKEFLKLWLPKGMFETDVDKHLAMTDDEVLSGLRAVIRDPNHRAHGPASHIANREHFKLLYERNPTDHARNPKAAKAIHDAACAEFGPEVLRFDPYDKPQDSPDFPVLGRDGRISSSLAASVALARVPSLAVDFVFAHRRVFADAEKWLKGGRDAIIGGGLGGR